MPWSPEALVEASRRVTAASSLVRVDPGAVARLAGDVAPASLSLPAWNDPGFLDGPDCAIAAWLVAYNAINYSYWTDAGPRWWTVVDGREVGREDEALGVMVAFAAAMRRGVPLDDGAWLARLDADTLGGLLSPAPGAGPLPMMEARLAALRELGRAWTACGGAAAMVRAAGGSAVALVDGLVTACPSWEDVRDAAGERLCFRKRAQLCVAMLHGRLQDRGLGRFHDVRRLAVFADYRLPQVLRGEGVLHLAPDLAARIDRGEEIPAGSAEEVDLRAATVVAADDLGAALSRRFTREVSAIVVDHVLWRLAVAKQSALPPFHRTRTTDY